MKFLILAAVVACAYAAPDKRPSQYAPPPPPEYPQPQQAYAPAPKPYRPAAPKPTYQQPAPQYVAAPQEQRYNYAPAPKKVIAILSQDFKLDDYGYSYNYETEDYQSKQETGKVIPGTKKQGAYGYEEDDGSLQVQGQFYYQAPDGTPITLVYRADENGFQPEGAHLPTPPPLTEAQVQAIAEHQQAVAKAQANAPAYQQPQSYEQPAASYQRPSYSAPRPKY